MKHPFKIEFLDHIAIRVSDMSRSQEWYANTMGLEVVKYEEWGEYPVFMVHGNFGIALFPANPEDSKIPVSRNVKIDHFAFRVTRESFHQAINYFKNHNIYYEIQDHYYFESVYLLDPDQHIVELTTPTDKLKN